MKSSLLGHIVVFRKTRCMVVAHDPITKKNPVLVPVNPDKAIGSGKGNAYTVKNINKIKINSKSY